MKEEILSIASDLREGYMTTNEAKQHLLRLFGVVAQSEQLVCQCSTNNISGVVNGVAYCEDCGHQKAN